MFLGDFIGAGLWGKKCGCFEIFEINIEGILGNKPVASVADG